jgi:hypothetical protein
MVVLIIANGPIQDTGIAADANDHIRYLLRWYVLIMSSNGISK